MSRTLMLIGIKMKKNIAELAHSDRLKIYVNHSKAYGTLAFKSILSV